MPILSHIERTYYQMLRNGSLLQNYPFLSGYYSEDEIQFTAIYLLLNNVS